MRSSNWMMSITGGDFGFERCHLRAASRIRFASRKEWIVCLCHNRVDWSGGSLDAAFAESSDWNGVSGE